MHHRALPGADPEWALVCRAFLVHGRAAILWLESALSAHSDANMGCYCTMIMTCSDDGSPAAAAASSTATTGEPATAKSAAATKPGAAGT